MSCLPAFVLQVQSVVVPVEECLVPVVVMLEERLFRLVQDVETHEGVGASLRHDGIERMLPDALCHVAVEGTRIEFSPLHQALAQSVVEVIHAVPKPQETLLEFRVLLNRKILEEFAQRLLLLGVYVVGGDGMEVMHVAEDMACRCDMLVDVVEVTQDNLAPAVELVKGFGIGK